MATMNETSANESKQRGPEMTYLAISLVVAWSCGLLFLAGRALNFIRLVYNDLAPGKNCWESRNLFRFYFLSFRFLTDASAIDPASLTEVGRRHRKGAIRNDRIMLAWALGGFVLLVWASAYFKGS
jgi:hypothetical protein